MISTSIYKRYIPAIVPPVESLETALCFVFFTNKLLVRTNKEALSIPTSDDLKALKIEIVNKQYLGIFDGYQCFGISIENDENDVKGMDFRDLRSLLGLLEEDIFLLAGRALQILNWNKMNKHCGCCGALTESKRDERVKVCLACGSTFYPRISPAIIVAITKADKILLAHNRNFKDDWYSIIAGFMDPGETFEDCVKREVYEEVGIKVKNIKYFGSQPWPFPDSLMIGFSAEFESGEILVDGIEINDADWYKKDKLPHIPSKDSIAGKLIEWVLENR